MHASKCRKPTELVFRLRLQWLLFHSLQLSPPSTIPMPSDPLTAAACCCCFRPCSRVIDALTLLPAPTYIHIRIRTCVRPATNKHESGKKTFGAQDFCTNNFRFMTGHISTVVQDLLVSSMLHSYVNLPRKFFNLMFNATF